MQIACPQCSMQYALDPRLLPPGGVPVQCTRCSHVFIAGTPAQTAPQGSQAMRSPAPAPQPSAVKTQAFGAVPPVPSVPPVSVASVGNKPHPAGPQPAQVATPPSVMRTQLFGAVPQVPPVGNVPPPQPPPAQVELPPSATTTQLFGAIPNLPPLDSIPRMSPAGARAQAGAVPSAPAPMVQAPGGAPVPGAQAAGVREPLPIASAVPAAEPLQSPPLEPLPRTAPQEPVVGVAATTTIELPDEEPVSTPGPFGSPVPPPGAPAATASGLPFAELTVEEGSPEDPPSPPGAPGPVAALPKPLELPPELLDESALTGGARERDKGPERSRGRVLLVAGIVLVLVLTAFLTSPAWRSKSSAVPHDVLVAKDEAVAVLRRDDSGSKEEALSRLKILSVGHPESVDLLAEVGIALALYMDDTRALMLTLQEKEERLKERISRLTEAKAPADWQSRVNTMRDELAAVQRELTPIKERGTMLAQESAQTLKRLAAAPEEEEKEAAEARMRARAMLNGALGVSEALDMVVHLAQSGQGTWSTLTLAEYVLNNDTATPRLVEEASAALERMREADKTFLRAYVLGARIALKRQEPAAALPLLDTVITLNPKHELARTLQAHAQALVRQQSEPAPTPEPPPEADPESTPAPESTPTP